MKYMSKLMNIENQIVNEELKDVVGGHGSRLKNLPPYLNIPSNKDTKDEPKDGGATYTW